MVANKLHTQLYSEGAVGTCVAISLRQCVKRCIAVFLISVKVRETMNNFERLVDLGLFKS